MRVNAFLLAGCLLAAGASGYGQDWGRPVWSDEFDGRAGSFPDASKWTYDVGKLNVNDELEIYCAPGSATAPCAPDEPNAYLDGHGHLVVHAVKTADGSWTSARLKTQGLYTFLYGRVEASMRLPLGAGLWPAFWMLGANITSVSWPSCGEVDVMENVPLSAGLGPSVIRSTLHGPGYSGSGGLGQNYDFPAGEGVDGFHVYGAIWSPNMVQFYVDDPRNVFFVRTASDLPPSTSWVFDHEFFAILNLAVGGDWPGPPDAGTPNPSTMLVDYVRFYKPAAVPGPAMTAAPISVSAGASGSTTLNLTSASGTGRVYLACSGAPPEATCALDPFVVDFTTVTQASSTVKVGTSASSSAGIPPAAVGLGSTALLALLGLWRPARLKRAAGGLALSALVLATIAAPSCGGGGGSSSASASSGSASRTPPGTYTVTIQSFTVSGDSSTLAVPLTVTP